VTGTGLLKDAAEEKGPIPPWSPRPRNAHEGFWNGLNPAGYKLVRRMLHSAQGLRLRNHRKRKNQRYSDAAWATLLSLGSRFRRQPLAPENATLTGKRGVTAQRGQAEGAAVPHECRHALAVSVTASRSRKKM
jgi:hypothetical protein